MDVSIVMPVYNERATIAQTLCCVLETEIPKEIVIVDDGSIDGTTELLKELEQTHSGPCTLKVIYQTKNQGKGAALRRGFQHVSRSIVIVQDADLEYNPNEYMALIRPILEDKADVVYGSRFQGGPHRVLLFWHSVGNKLLTLISNMFTNLNLTDMETGYKAFRRSVIEKIQFVSNRFGFEPEFTVKVAKSGFRIYEVPISYSGRTYAEGKKINWKDGIAALWWIIRFSVKD
jgi:glycosyltransferase involved in cell wall biosynthesis